MKIEIQLSQSVYVSVNGRFLCGRVMKWRLVQGVTLCQLGEASVELCGFELRRKRAQKMVG